MAAAAGLAPALLGPLAPPTVSTTATTSSPVKTMQQLLNEIDQAKLEIEAATKTLEKVDTGRKKAAANREQSVEGRTKIKDLTERVISLEKQMNAMTKQTDPNWSIKTFDRTKKNALKSLSNLSSKLNHADKHLEKATGSTPIVTAPPADTQSTTTPANAQPGTVTTEGENTKGVGSFISKLPFVSKKKSASKKASSVPTTQAESTSTKPVDKTGDTAQKTAKDEVVSDGDEEEEEEDEESDDDDDVVSDKKKEPAKSPRSIKKIEPIAPDRKKIQVSNVENDETDDSEDEDEDDDDEGADDNRQLLNELQSRTLPDESSKDPNSDGRRSRTPTTPRSSKRVPAIKTDSTISSSPAPKKMTTIAPPLPPSRKKTPSPKRRTEFPAAKKKEEDSEGDSYFEEEEEEEEEEEDEEEELRGLRDTGDHEAESDHEYDEPDEEETAVVNAYVQELRTNKYTPGTQFVVTHDLTGVQTGDLTIHKGEILTLVDQRPEDWWLFKNVQTQQQGVAPINHIQLLSGRQPRRRAKPNTSTTTLVDAFKANNNIPAGFISSDLAPLTQIEEYQLWRALVPKMTESNLAFADLHWRADIDKLHVQDVTYQKILTMKECIKIPRVKGEQIRVLDRCVRVCLYDGFEVVSNINTIRALIPRKIDERDLTEDWHFVPNDINTLIDEQSQLLIRSNRSNPGQHLHLLIELSQWCQSTVTQEKCEIACGWSMVPLDDDKPPLISDTKSYNELLHGGHTDDTNVLLDPQYKIFRSDGLSGMIDRYKRARIKFSIESRESDVDLLYDNLPIQSIVVPINLIKTLVFFRNELAYQLHKRQHPTGLSTTPIDSIFLSTFFQTLDQPDLIYTIRRLYRSRKKRYLNSSSSSQQQREEFIRTYELFIYPLLHYRQLPPYDFHDIATLNERRKLINEMVYRQLPTNRKNPQDILSILLDPNLTDKWTPFTTDEISFTLQKYIHDFTRDVVA